MSAPQQTSEYLRLRDEWPGTNLRLIVRARSDGDPGAEVVLLATDREWEAFPLDTWDVEVVIDALRRAVIGSCRFCDDEGNVDGPRGPEVCEHPHPFDAGGGFDSTRAPVTQPGMSPPGATMAS